MRMARWFVVSALLAALGLAGCSTTPSTGGSSSLAGANKGDAKPSAVASVTGAVGGGFKAATDWMKPKPTVTPAQDPTSLAVKTRKPGADIYVSMARIHESRNQNDQAAKQYEKALSVDAKDEAALLGYARLLDRQNKFDEALKYYSQSVAAHPKSAGSQNDLGLCLARRGQFPQAAQSLKMAVSLDPQRPLYRNNLATVLVEMQREDEALQELLAVHDPAAARYNMGVLLHQAKRPDRAVVHFAEAVRLNPSMRPAQEWLARLNAPQNEAVVARTIPPAAAPERTPVTAQPVSASSEMDNLMPRRDPRRYDDVVAPEPPSSGASSNSPPRVHTPVRLPSPTLGEPENAPLPR